MLHLQVFSSDECDMSPSQLRRCLDVQSDDSPDRKNLPGEVGGPTVDEPVVASAVDASVDSRIAHIKDCLTCNGEELDAQRLRECVREMRQAVLERRLNRKLMSP